MRLTFRQFWLFSALLPLLISTGTTRGAVQSSLKPPQEYLRMPGLKGIRQSELKLSSFGTSDAAAMKLDLTIDAPFTVSRDRVEPLDNSKGFVWYGRVDGAPYSTAIFVVDSNTVSGHVTRGDGAVYEVRTAEDGTKWTLEIDQSQFPDGDDAVPVPRDAAGTAAVAADTASNNLGDTDDSSTIDVLVLYTSAARVAAGGAASIQQLIQLGISETNQGYANSDVVQRVRLVRAQEVNYAESSSGIATDLNRLRTAGDGFMDEAQTLRDTYGADLVSLWVNSSEKLCGVGYLLNDPMLSGSFLSQYGFSVVQQACATGYYTFGHEMGHNMGAHHAKEDLNSDGSVPTGAYPYSNGYKNTYWTKFRTIMAYDGNCACPRINYWSNPLVLYGGIFTGVAPESPQGAANSLTLNNTRPLVASFRPTVVPITSSDRSGPLLTITSHGNGETVYSAYPISITISGVATDAGQGDNAISSVAVNGLPAADVTATGTSMTYWNRSLTLSAGPNTITVVATDNSLNRNATMLSITINVIITTSSTASTYHVFPQFADGVLSDGSYYRNTLMVSNRDWSTPASCVFHLNGLTVNGSDTFPFTFPPFGWTITPIGSRQSLRSGYATLQCSSKVEAQLIYSEYSAAGIKLSEATVFSSPPAASVEILADTREGARMGIAITNDSSQAATYSIDVYSSTSSSPIASTSLALDAYSNQATFLDQLVSVPPEIYGPVTVTSSNGMASVIGLRYTGNIFTTIPEEVTSTASPTARSYHIFPQFADGVLDDGSYYRTTVMMDNPGHRSSNCSLRLRGLTVNGSSLFDYGTLEPGGYAVDTSIRSMQSLRSGYAVLNCSASVEAQLLYSHYSASGTKISETTVFSSPNASAQQVMLLADTREGAHFALAIANDSDQSQEYLISFGGSITGSITVGPRSNRAFFLVEPLDYYGPVYVSSNKPPSVIGLRYTGEAFTAIPGTIP